MNLIERLKELETKATPGPWDMATSFTETDDRLMEEMRNALPKLLAVVEAVKYQQQCLDCEGFNGLLPRVEDALAALEDTK